jgi:hypothetical protein
MINKTNIVDCFICFSQIANANCKGFSKQFSFNGLGNMKGILFDVKHHLKNASRWTSEIAFLFSNM